jgi:hypothetical protein
MPPFLMMGIETVETVSRNLSCSDHRAKSYGENEKVLVEAKSVLRDSRGIRS